MPKQLLKNRDILDTGLDWLIYSEEDTEQIKC